MLHLLIIVVVHAVVVSVVIVGSLLDPFGFGFQQVEERRRTGSAADEHLANKVANHGKHGRKAGGTQSAVLFVFAV